MARLKKGLGKFVFYLVGILAAHYVDLAAEPLVRVNFRAFFVLYLSACEALSIFRHLCRFGVKIPKQLISRLESLQDCELPQPRTKGASGDKS